MNHHFYIRKLTFFSQDREVSFSHFPEQFATRRCEIEGAFVESVRIYGKIGYGPNGKGNFYDSTLRPDSRDYFDPVFVEDGIQAPPM
jgi:hypothetical protein